MYSCRWYYGPGMPMYAPFIRFGLASRLLIRPMARKERLVYVPRMCFQGDNFGKQKQATWETAKLPWNYRNEAYFETFLFEWIHARNVFPRCGMEFSQDVGWSFAFTYYVIFHEKPSPQTKGNIFFGTPWIHLPSLIGRRSPLPFDAFWRCFGLFITVFAVGFREGN